MKKIVACGMILLLTVSLLGGCAKKSASSAKKDVTSQIEEILGNTVAFDESDPLGKIMGSNRIFSDDEYGRKISEKIEYKIKSVNVEGESGTVTVEITSPDVYALLEEAALEASSVDDVDELLDTVYDNLENEYYTEISETFTCDIKFKNEKWNLVYTVEFLDALSGNLYSGYMNIADSIII